MFFSSWNPSICRFYFVDTDHGKSMQYLTVCSLWVTAPCSIVDIFLFMYCIMSSYLNIKMNSIIAGLELSECPRIGVLSLWFPQTHAASPAEMGQLVQLCWRAGTAVQDRTNTSAQTLASATLLPATICACDRWRCAHSHWLRGSVCCVALAQLQTQLFCTNTFLGCVTEQVSIWSAKLLGLANIQEHKTWIV